MPWLTEAHRQKLMQARTILVSMLEPPAFGERTQELGIMSNTEEYEMISDIVEAIEELLGY